MTQYRKSIGVSIDSYTGSLGCLRFFSYCAPAVIAFPEESAAFASLIPD